MLARIAAFACSAALLINAVSGAAVELKKRDYQGVATYYLQNGNAGSCGQYHSDSDLIVALGNYWMQNEYDGPYCGASVTLTNQNTGQSVTATVEDTCESCDETHVDCSVGTFEAMGATEEQGEVPIDWYFN